MNVSEELLTAISDPSFLSAYDAWRNNPVTQRVFLFAKEVARPCGLPKTTGEDALYYSGQFDACDNFLAFLLDMRGYVEKRQQVAAAARLHLKTDYGTMPKTGKAKASVV